VSEGALIRRLGEAGWERGRVGTLDLLARAGLPVPEGVVLARRAHERFLGTSGALHAIRAARAEVSPRQRAIQIRLGYAFSPLEEELNHEICEALIQLHARAVAVLSEDLERRGLTSIPEVRSAVLDAWLSPHGIERQLEAVARGEDLPTWPVLAQRELNPQYTGWSSTGGAPLSGSHLYEPAPYGVEPVEGRGIADYTLKARAVLGEHVSIRWGLEEGRWYVLSVGSCAIM
jgi:hypothetical protein